MWAGSPVLAKKGLRNMNTAIVCKKGLGAICAAVIVAIEAGCAGPGPRATLEPKVINLSAVNGPAQTVTVWVPKSPGQTQAASDELIPVSARSTKGGP